MLVAPLDPGPMAVMQPSPGIVRKLESLQVELKRTFAA